MTLTQPDHPLALQPQPGALFLVEDRRVLVGWGHVDAVAQVAAALPLEVVRERAVDDRLRTNLGALAANEVHASEDDVQDEGTVLEDVRLDDSGADAVDQNPGVLDSACNGDAV